MSLRSHWMSPKRIFKSRGEENGQDEENRKWPKSVKEGDGGSKGDLMTEWRVFESGSTQETESIPVI